MNHFQQPNGKIGLIDQYVCICTIDLDEGEQVGKHLALELEGRNTEECL
jgi:hypothetical protein